jgi:HEAT repeat protein
LPTTNPVSGAWPNEIRKIWGRPGRTVLLLVITLMLSSCASTPSDSKGDLTDSRDHATGSAYPGAISVARRDSQEGEWHDVCVTNAEHEIQAPLALCLPYLDSRSENRSVATLLRTLRDTDKTNSERVEAALVLGRLGHAEGGPLVIPFLSNRNPVDLQRAIWVVGELRERGAVPALIGILKDRTGLLTEVCAIPMVAGRGGPSIPVDMGPLFFESAWIRNCDMAAAALGKIADDRAVSALMECLNSQDASLRDVAALALGTAGDDRALSALKEVASRPEASSRHSARRAMLLIEARRRPLNLLVDDVRSEDRFVRYCAVLALGDRGDLEQIPALQALQGDRAFISEGACYPYSVRTMQIVAEEALQKIRIRLGERHITK